MLLIKELFKNNKVINKKSKDDFVIKYFLYLIQGSLKNFYKLEHNLIKKFIRISFKYDSEYLCILTFWLSLFFKSYQIYSECCISILYLN